MPKARFALIFAAISWLSVAWTPAGELDLTLLDAARRGRTAAVRDLLDQGASARAASLDGATALHWAAENDLVDMADLLLGAGADPNARNRFGASPILLASVNGGVEVIERLLAAGADPNAATNGGETALMLAARTGRLPAVKALLARGANLDARENVNSQTALMWAAAEGNLSVVDALVKAKAEVDARSVGGFTALLFAARQGRIAVTERLLAAGADVNQTLPSGQSASRKVSRSKGGSSPLDLAVDNAHYELASLLLRAGANPSGGRASHTPLHAISWVRKPGTGSHDPPPPGSGGLDSLALVRELVAHGADVNARVTVRTINPRTVMNMKGATPFMLAARTGDAALMRALCELGADPLLNNEDGTTPLMAAAGVGVRSPTEDAGTDAEICQAIEVALEFGADINAVDRHGETAMHGAAYRHAPLVARLLAERGADIRVWNTRNDSNWTPLRIATGVHRTANFRTSPETAAAIAEIMAAAGVAPILDDEEGASTAAVSACP